MKTIPRLWLGFNNVWQSFFSILELHQKKLLATIFLVHLFTYAFPQGPVRLLSRYDSCHVQPPRQTAVGRQALRVNSPIVRVAYVIPSNRTAQPDAVANLQNVITVGQQWYQAQMEQNGFGPKTFVYETEEDGVTPFIHVVQVPETDEFLREDLWSRTTQAASSAGIPLWTNGEVWLVVPEAHLMQPDGTVTGGVALGASYGSGNSPGVAMIGSNALPLFNPVMITDDTPYDGKVIPAIGPYPMKQDATYAWFEGTTYSSIASSWIGAVVHEMGHAFGLAHDFRNDNNFHGNLMGNGLRGMRGSLFPEKYPQDYTRLEYASALILNASHYYNRDKSVTAAPSVSYTIPGSVIPQRGHVHIAFRASDNDSLSLAHLRFDGNTVAEIPLEGNSADTAFVVPYFRQGTVNSYTLAVHDRQGNINFSFVEFTVPGGYNQAPVPYIQINPPVQGLNQPITLNASASSDDESLSSVLASWDVDNDGQFDTAPSTNKILQYRYENAGNYLIRLKLTDAMGGQTISTAVSINIPGERKVAVESFTLINAEKDIAVATLKEGMEISLLAWEDNTFSIRANTSAGTIDRVEFELIGPITHQFTDPEQPYALFGDSTRGNFTGRKLLAGQYTLTATPFSPSGKGIPRTVSFRVIDKSVPGQAAVITDKTIGGTNNDYAFSVVPATDGGYLLAGYSNSDASADKSENGKGLSDYWIVKMDAQYNKLWDKTFGGDSQEELRKVVPAADGRGYLLAGFSISNRSGDKSEDAKGEYDYWVIKIDNQGNKEWDKTFGGSGNDALFAAVATTDGGYLLGGFSDSDVSEDKSENSKGGRDFWVIKIDHLGNRVWDKTLGGQASDEVRTVLALPEGGYLLGGGSDSDISGDKTENSKGSNDEWVVKIDNLGNKVWDKTLGGSDVDNLMNIILAPDGGYLLSGDSRSDISGDKTDNSKGGWDFWIVKIDRNGDKEWDKTFGGRSTDGTVNAIAIPKGGYLLAGYSISDVSGDKSENGRGNWDYWVVKIDNHGNKVWDKTVGGSDDDELLSAILTPTEHYLLAGLSRSNISGEKGEKSKGEADYWIVELKEPRLPIVTSLTLMNAHTNKEIKPLNAGDEIRLREVGNILLDIRANIAADQLQKVTFDLTGPITFHQTETVAPYALFGDIQGDFNGRTLLPGTYSLTVTALVTDAEKASRTISFTVIERVRPMVTSLTLMDAHTSQEIKEITNGDVINVKEVGRLLDIRANVTGDQITKVTFDLKGPLAHSQAERESPYALFGDIQGDFNGRKLLAGNYQLTVTAYASEKEKSFRTVSFTVIDRPLSAVASLTLMNAHTNQEIQVLRNGDVIQLEEVGDRLLDVRADISDPGVNKVIFDLKGPITFHQTESVAPYALFGDIQGEYNGRRLRVGSYTLTVTPYKRDVKGIPYTISFTVTKDGSMARSTSVEVYPIPASNVINIKHGASTAQALMTLRDANGNILLRRPLSTEAVDQLDVSTFHNGIYYLKIAGPEGLQIIKLVVE